MSSKASLILAVCVVAVGCAHPTPKQLSDARAAYERAAKGPAASLTPADLHDAELALKKAESTFDDEGDSEKTRDRAYVAERKARIAEARAGAAAANKEAAKWRARNEAAEAQALEHAQSSLSATRAALRDKESKLQKQGGELAEERRRREAAEKRAEALMADLARIATVEKQERGTVITLPGGVLFESGKAKLLPSAEARLTQVADTLTKSSPDSTMVVEGHTDTQGSDSFNQKLSEERANSVRTYLVSHGVAADRITAKGLGESTPVADNKSAEGRATNRRVEIIVSPSGG